MVIQIEFRGQGYGIEWMDRLTQWLWSSSCLATLPSHRCTNPVRGFLRPCYATRSVEKQYRHYFQTGCTNYRGSVRTLHGFRQHHHRNVSCHCCDSSSQSHRSHKKKKPKQQIIPRLTRRSHKKKKPKHQIIPRLTRRSQGSA